MKKLLLILFAIKGLAQSPEMQWQKLFGGTNYDVMYDVKSTFDGGFIMIGMSNSNNGDLSFNHGDYDIWVVKTNQLGVVLWQKALGNFSDDKGFSIQQTIDGGYILASHTSGNIAGSHGSYDFLVIKLDSQGEVEWQKLFGGSSADFAKSIKQTVDGGYVVVGTTNSINGDVTDAHFGGDIWVLKLNGNGGLEWQKTLGGNNIDIGNDICQTSDNGFIVVGYTNSIDGDITINNGAYNAWVIKLNNSGLIEWQKTYGGSQVDSFKSVVSSDNGDFIAVGNITSTDAGINSIRGSNDIWLVRFDSTGGLVWQNSYGGSNDDGAGNIIKTSNGEYIVTGTTSSDDGDVIVNNGSTNGWVFKVNESGDLLWQQNYGGGGTDVISAGAIANDEGYILAGQTTSNDGYFSQNHGGIDSWVFKLGPESLKTTDFQFQNLFIYPNPCKSKFELRIFDNLPIDKIIVKNILQETILENNAVTYEVDIEALASGIYFLQATSNNKTYQTKFIKE